ncbi:MAG: recombinase family protein, partial [Candidatus Taylorbacteria bacterium]
MKNNTKDIKYFLYARKSSESEDRQVQSIDDQINRLKKLATELNLDIKEILIESHSAKTPNARPIFNKMLERIENGEANGILCWQINRLSRNPVDSARIQWLLQQSIIKSVQTTDGERRPEDNAVLFSVESGVANQYIIDLRKNIKRGLASKLEKGILPCLAPAGYLNESYDRNIVKDQANFALIRKMWDMMLTGNYSPAKILKIANKEWGYRTRKTRRSGGIELSLSGLYKIFNSQFYAGVIDYGGKKYQGIHDPMITWDEFDRVQILLGRKGKARPKTYEFAFTGSIHCKECGGFYTAEVKTKIIKKTGQIKLFTYYHCTRRKKDIKCTQMGSVSKEYLELQISEVLDQYTIMPEFRDWAIEILRKSNDEEIATRTKIYGNQQKTLNETQSQLDNLTKMRYRDLIDDAQFLKEKEILQKQIAELRKSIDQTEDRADRWLDLTERTFNFATYAKEAFEIGTLQDKKEILIALCSNPVIKDKRLIIQAEKWFVKVKDDYTALKEQYDRLELAKKPLTGAQKEALEHLRTQWWRWAESASPLTRPVSFEL